MRKKRPSSTRPILNALLHRRGTTLEAWLTEHGITTLAGVVAVCRTMGATLPSPMAASIDRLLHKRAVPVKPNIQENEDGDSITVITPSSGPKPALVKLASSSVRRGRSRKHDDEVAVDETAPHVEPSTAAQEERERVGAVVVSDNVWTTAPPLPSRPDPSFTLSAAM